MATAVTNSTMPPYRFIALGRPSKQMGFTNARSCASEPLRRARAFELATRFKVELDRHSVPLRAERSIPALRSIEPGRQRGPELGEGQAWRSCREGRESGLADDGVHRLGHARALLLRIRIAELDR